MIPYNPIIGTGDLIIYGGLWFKWILVDKLTVGAEPRYKSVRRTCD